MEGAVGDEAECNADYTWWGDIFMINLGAEEGSIAASISQTRPKSKRKAFQKSTTQPRTY